MVCRSISWFISIFVAVVVATDDSRLNSITGSDPEVTDHCLKTDNTELTTMAAVNEAQETVSVELAALLDAGVDAVVTLVAGETRLAAHRAVLEARSSVFQSMFGQNALEARNTEIEVTNVEGPMLRQVLAYCYTQQAPQLPNMAPQLLAAAATYGLSGLKDACEQQVVGQLAVETAAALAVLAVRHSCSSLKQAAVTLIKAHSDKVMKTPGWKEAEDVYTRDVLELFHLIVESPAEYSMGDVVVL